MGIHRFGLKLYLAEVSIGASRVVSGADHVVGDVVAADEVVLALAVRRHVQRCIS